MQHLKMVLIIVILSFPVLLTEISYADYGKDEKHHVIEDRWFAKDKAKHFSVSFLVSTLSYYSVKESSDSHTASVAAGISVPLGLGLYKEFKDAGEGRNWSYKDFVWDVIGVGLAVSVFSK